MARNDDTVIWTPVSTPPWRFVLRGAAGLVFLGLCGWGSLIIAQHVPAMFFDVLRLPPIGRIEAKAPALVEERPVQVQTIATKPPVRTGPVVRDVTE